MKTPYMIQVFVPYYGKAIDFPDPCNEEEKRKISQDRFRVLHRAFKNEDEMNRSKEIEDYDSKTQICVLSRREILAKGVHVFIPYLGNDKILKILHCRYKNHLIANSELKKVLNKYPEIDPNTTIRAIIGRRIVAPEGLIKLK